VVTVVLRRWADGLFSADLMYAMYCMEFKHACICGGFNVLKPFFYAIHVDSFNLQCTSSSSFIPLPLNVSCSVTFQMF
jgi:hypothetical protein